MRESSTPARVVAVHKDCYRVRTESGEFLADLAGTVRYRSTSLEEFPSVGDWVVIERPGDGRARIHCVLPRKTKLSRKVSGRVLDEQVIAANIDTVFLVSSLNNELNLRRIERYLSLIWNSGASPVVLLSKADLCADPRALAEDVEAIAMGVPVHVLSALTGEGLDCVRTYLAPGRTIGLVGSSGVGKSTIINSLAGEELLAVGAVREDDDRGRHTTTVRQMIFLPGGGIVIDTPGMRELQLWGSGDGLEQAFDDIAILSQQCRYRDCRHRDEPGCNVQESVLNGTLDAARLESYRKLEAELLYLERKVDPQAAREEKERWKRIHKAMRHHTKGGM